MVVVDRVVVVVVVLVIFVVFALVVVVSGAEITYIYTLYSITLQNFYFSNKHLVSRNKLLSREYHHVPCFGFIQRAFPLVPLELHAKQNSLLDEVSFKVPQMVPGCPHPLPDTTSYGQEVLSKVLS